MTASPWMSWFILVVSLSNTILLFWLGLTVLLNTERRTPGLYLAGGALLLAGMFFLSHTAIIGFSPSLRLDDLDLWWRVGWIPVTCLPFAWYSVMLWYGGYWEPESTLRKRHRPWFFASLIFAGIFVILLGFAHSLPSAGQLLVLDLTADPSMFGAPVIVVFYPLYAVLCTGLTLDVLRWPTPSKREMADLARQRAWPWLGAGSLALFIVSLLVGGTVFWVLISARQYTGEEEMVQSIYLLDLVILVLISFTILLVGQAIVSYEVFTGKSLPRRGLQRYWRRVILLAFGFSLAVGTAVVLDLHAIYVSLLATLVLTVFYALMSWRSFEERERLMDSLRPFLASQDLYRELLFDRHASEAKEEDDFAMTSQAAFQALCREVLETKLAYLVPMGVLAPLAGAPLAYPRVQKQPVITLNLPMVEEDSGWMAVDPQLHGGANWAVPLRRRGSLSGVLLLGGKHGGGLYTHEEVEVARLAGESLLDAQASAELARRLMALQRQRLAESQVLDQQARRVLHDDILPQLHETILQLSGSKNTAGVEQMLADLGSVHGRIAGLLRQLPPATNPELTRLGLGGALRVLIHEEYRSHFDWVEWAFSPEATQQMEKLQVLPAEVVYFAVREAVRNAARYGRGGRMDRPLHLTVQASFREGLSICVEDDGIGMAHLAEGEANGGAGQGLALHSTLLAVLGGTLSVESRPKVDQPGADQRGSGTRVVVHLPAGTIL